jgi:hypothetical protein
MKVGRIEKVPSFTGEAVEPGETEAVEPGRTLLTYAPLTTTPADK